MRAGRMERRELNVADELDAATIIPRCACRGCSSLAGVIGARETLVASGLLSGGVTVLFLLASPVLRRTELEPARQPSEP
jgi:hypothetical protein